jgi:hypothetical protein
LELQVALLLLAGVGLQGYTEWQCANMVNRTNKLVTDIFVALLQYKCGLPQGTGFSVEIANLYAMLLLLWWNMDPVCPHGTIAPFTSPRHGYPLFADGICEHFASLAWVDDAKRLLSLSKLLYTCEQFFRRVQGYCDLLTDLSLVIKMGCNVRKCTLYLYNIPEDIPIPPFTSIAWSYDAQGPTQGIIKVVAMLRDLQGNRICYDIPRPLHNSVPQNIKDILAPYKYLGITTNAQLDLDMGKEKMINKLSQRIGLISHKTHSIKETRILHNMLVCQVATFSTLCASFSLTDCTNIDKQIIRSYQHRLRYVASDAKHSIFISEKQGGIGVCSFTKAYVGALLRDTEVYISNTDSDTTHALLSSISEATKQSLWKLTLLEEFHLILQWPSGLIA